jgi:hypothetical protein
MNSDFTQKEVPYLYVNGAMCFDSQGEIVRYRGETKGNYKHESQPASPYNVFVGTISAKSNNFILHGDLYLMDEYNSNKKYMVKGENDIVTDYNGNQGITYGDNIFGQTNSSQLYKWTSDTLNKTNSQHESFGGNIYCNGNLTLGGGTFDGDIKVKGDLTIKDTTVVHGDVVVGGKLKVLNNGNNDKFTVDGTVYATNPDGYRAPGDTSDNTPETYRSYPNFYEGPEELKDLSHNKSLIYKGESYMQNRLPKRSEVAVDLTWRLEDIYDDEAKWEEELKEATELADKMAGYAGKLTENGETLLEYLQLDERLDLLTDRIYGYAHMREDQDTADAKYQALKQRASSSFVKIAEKTAFMRP